ncbi:hypothetical protein M1M86_02350 [Dehalococcoidales bacterium]|nr:hypothetical protein [Dehalococcoidales bacterium]
MFIPLFKDSLSILRRVRTVEYLIGDAAYDSVEAMREAEGFELMPVIKLNQRRGKPKGIRRKVGEFLEIEEGRRVFSLRGGI